MTAAEARVRAAQASLRRAQREARLQDSLLEIQKINLHLARLGAAHQDGVLEVDDGNREGEQHAVDVVAVLARMGEHLRQIAQHLAGDGGVFALQAEFEHVDQWHRSSPRVVGGSTTVGDTARAGGDVPSSRPGAGHPLTADEVRRIVRDEMAAAFLSIGNHAADQLNHSSPPLVAGTDNVGDGAAPGVEEAPGADHPQGGAR